MPEQKLPISTDGDRHFSQHSTDGYIEELGTARTARMASEHNFHSPDPSDVLQATRGIRADIEATFNYEVADFETVESKALQHVKSQYWARASRVDPKHGAIPGYRLEDYLTIHGPRSYRQIKEMIEQNYPEGSIPRSVLRGVDAYHEGLQINPVHAATIMMEMIERHLEVISSLADWHIQAESRSPQEAATLAIASFVEENVGQHINHTKEQYGVGNEIIFPVMGRNTFYGVPRSNIDVSLTISEADARGLIEVYHLQGRPYSDTELAFGNDIAQIPAMQMAMLWVQESLIEVAKTYLEQHPERASGRMENFSEVFVPEYHEDYVELLPNPKLVRAMVNNIMPGIAISVMARNAAITELDASDIQAGVQIAVKSFRLFQTRIAQFGEHNLADGTVVIHSVFPIVCPASRMFPNHLLETLASYYERAKEFLSSSATHPSEDQVS